VAVADRPRDGLKRIGVEFGVSPRRVGWRERRLLGDRNAVALENVDGVPSDRFGCGPFVGDCDILNDALGEGLDLVAAADFGDLIERALVARSVDLEALGILSVVVVGLFDLAEGGFGVYTISYRSRLR